MLTLRLKLTLKLTRIPVQVQGAVQINASLPTVIASLASVANIARTHRAATGTPDLPNACKVRLLATESASQVDDRKTMRARRFLTALSTTPMSR